MLTNYIGTHARRQFLPEEHLTTMRTPLEHLQPAKEGDRLGEPFGGKTTVQNC